MTAPTVSQAVAHQDTGPQALIRQYSNDFATVLPSHIEPAHWVRLAQGALRRDAKLAEAAAGNPPSFLAALLECARLGHEPGTDAYALTHFRNSKTGVPEIVGIEQYQGEIERMYRAGAVTSVIADVVREKDLYVEVAHPGVMALRLQRYLPGEDFDTLLKIITAQPGTPVHWKGFLCKAAHPSESERGALVLVYAYARLVGGAVSLPVEMPKDEVMKHKAQARTKTIWEGPWEKSMWLKTAVHELEKWVPTSAEYIKERLRATAEANRIRSDSQFPQATVDTATGEIHDAEIVPDERPEWPQAAEPGSKGGEGK